MKKNQNLGDRGSLEITSVVSARDYKPYVQFTWGDFRSQMTVKEVEQFCLDLIECKMSAEGDAIFFKFMKEKVKMEDNQIYQMMIEFRQYRDELRSEK